MPSRLRFGSLVATAILSDFDLDERINPSAYTKAVCPSVCLCEDVPVCEMLRKLQLKTYLFEEGGRKKERKRVRDSN